MNSCDDLLRLLSDGWYHGCPRRSGHGNPDRKGVPRAEDDDQKGDYFLILFCHQ